MTVVRERIDDEREIVTCDHRGTVTRGRMLDYGCTRCDHEWMAGVLPGVSRRLERVSEPEPGDVVYGPPPPIPPLKL